MTGERTSIIMMICFAILAFNSQYWQKKNGNFLSHFFLGIRSFSFLWKNSEPISNHSISIKLWPNGLGVWFLLWVQEVPGSNPGLAHKFSFLKYYLCFKKKKKRKRDVGDTRSWTKDLPDCSRMLYHWAISPLYRRGVSLLDIYL